jgi:hypothetical protein
MFTPNRNLRAKLTDSREFNFVFSNTRVKVEHTIGIIKDRWESLRGTRTQYRKKDNLKQINCHIIATGVAIITF